MDTRDLSPGDRRELRSLIKRQFAVLRNDVKRRKDELEAEVEAELLRRYQQRDEHLAQAQREIDTLVHDCQRAIRAVVDSVNSVDPTVNAALGYHNQIVSKDENRAQLRRAAISAIPQQIADALTRLDQQEIDLLRELTVGALDSDQAQRFLGSVPTVGELVPRARLAQIEGSV